MHKLSPLLRRTTGLPRFHPPNRAIACLHQTPYPRLARAEPITSRFFSNIPSRRALALGHTTATDTHLPQGLPVMSTAELPQKYEN